MTPENRTSLIIARAADYFSIMRTTIFTLAAMAAVIELGPGGYSAPLTMLVVATAVFGSPAGGTALDDLASLRDDMDEDTAQTSYGKSVKDRNFSALKMMSAILLGLVAVAELYTLFT